MRDFLRKECLFIISLGASILIFLWDVLTLQETFLYGDYKLQFFPWYMEYAKAIKHFSLPFWTQHMGIGFPLFAEGQVGPLYPLNIVMFFLLPPLAAYNYSIVLHFMIGGVSMYVLTRALGLKGLPAVIPAMLFMFASPYAGCFSNIASLRVLCWLPLVFSIVLFAFEKRKGSILLITGILFGMQLLAGAMQMAVYAIAAGLSYFLFNLVSYSLTFRERAKFILYCSCGLIIAFVLFSPQYLATQRLVAFSNRPSQHLAFALWNSFFPCGIITLIFPHLAVLFRSMVYIGILPLLFSLAALFCLKNKQAVFFFGFFIVSLLLAFGKFNPLYAGLLKATHLYIFRTPTKFLFFSAFSLIVLSGFGMQYVLEKKDTARLWLFLKISLVIACVAVGGALFAQWLLTHFENPVLALAKSFAERYLYEPQLHTHPFSYYLAKIQGQFAYAKSALSLGNIFVYIPVFNMMLSLCLLWGWFQGKFRRPVFILCSVVLVAVDILFFSLIGTGFRGNIVNVKQELAGGTLTDFLKKETTLFRVYLFESDTQKDMLLEPNSSMYFSISNIGMYTPLAFSQYRFLLKDLGCVDDSMGISLVNKDSLYGNLALLGRLNVKYILSKVDLENNALTPVGQFGSIKLYRNNYFMPRAFMVRGARYVQDKDALLQELRDPSFLAEDSVLLQEKHAHQPAMAFISKSAITRYSDESVLIETESSADGFLFLADYYYPGWEAFVDNVRTKIYKANFIARAVFVPKGKHHVRFIYSHPIISFNNERAD
jgi:hypothetical protein